MGLIGIILVSVSGIASASNSDGFCHNCELKNESMSMDNTIELYNKCCTPFTMAEKTFSLLALISGSFMWSISSGKVYDPLFYFFFPS